MHIPLTDLIVHPVYFAWLAVWVPVLFGCDAWLWYKRRRDSSRGFSPIMRDDETAGW